MNTFSDTQLSTVTGPVFIALSVEMDEEMHGDSRVTFRADGRTVEGLVAALTTLTGDLDATAIALAAELFRQNDHEIENSVEDTIDLLVHVGFHPPLVASYQVEIASPAGVEVVTITVTTPSIGSLIGALFIHFSGPITRIRDVLEHGLGNEFSGIQLSTNVRHR